MMMWYKLYLTFVGHDRDPNSPFFVNPDGRYTTYQELLSSFRAAMARVPGITSEETLKYGLHGLRVLGYNCWRAANGEDVAALQGGWGSSAHRSYGRETLELVLQVPQKAANYAASHTLPPMPLDLLSADPLGQRLSTTPARPPRAAAPAAVALARPPLGGTAAAVEFLHQIVVDSARPSSRRAPTQRH